MCQEQRDEHGRDAERLDHAKEFALYVFAPAHQVASQIDDEQEFRCLHRLEAREAETDPAPRAIDAQAQAGHEHQQQQDHREKQEDEGIALEPVQFDAHDHQAHGKAQAQEHQVADQIVERSGVLAIGDGD